MSWWKLARGTFGPVGRSLPGRRVRAGHRTEDVSMEPDLQRLATSYIAE
jgi:hypothetical protein